MKHVAKGASPVSFENWKGKANADWEPTYPDLQNPEKQDIQVALLTEQGWVCCYCGRSVSLSDSHIEHFRPQNGGYSELQLNYENLLASCLRELKPGLPLHCGHAKTDNFDEAKQISPLEPTCEQRFIYTQLGEILPADQSDVRAAYMMSLLALDTPFLRDARAAVVSKVLNVDFLNTASTEELQQLRDAFRRRDNEGKLPDFGHAVARYAEQWLGGTENAPPEPPAV